jgi:hypothetical protein
MGSRAEFFIEHNLSQTRAVAQVNKNQVAQITAAVHPAHEDSFFASVGGAQSSALVSTL